MHKASGIPRFSSMHRYPISIYVTVNHFSSVCQKAQFRGEGARTIFT